MIGNIMRKALFVFVLIGVGLVLASMQDPKVSDRRARDILDAAAKKIQSYRTIKINFSFTEAEEGRDGVVRRGRVWLKGDKYHLRFAGQEVFSDGVTKWTYIRDAEEVHITALNAGDDELANPLALLRNYNDRFTVRLIREETYNGKRVDVVDLYPKQRRSYHRVRLRIEKGTRQIISTAVYFTNNNSQNVDVETFVTDEPIPDTHFVWDAARHPGVEIIDLR
jgi:outer membrane lipoprotein-sorting protein